MIIVDTHIITGCLIEVTIGSREDDVTWQKNALELLWSGWSLECQSVVVGWRCRSQQSNNFLHDCHLGCLHVDWLIIMKADDLK